MLTSQTTGDAGRGWYLYGITRSGLIADVLKEESEAADTAGIATAPLQLLECLELAAVVRPVPLADFEQSVLQERLKSAAQLEAILRSHNRVIEAVHMRQPILPAKFGSVYAHASEIEAALRSALDTLLPQLHRLEGCDEWAVHLHVDQEKVRARAATDDPTVQRLRDEHAAARPGRAYFLERQLAEALDAAKHQSLLTAAQRIAADLAGEAVASNVSQVGAVDDAKTEVEILHAAFLVARDCTERFEGVLRAATAADDSLRYEITGPWPPYSFATQDHEEAP